jgi:hypothetical protein
MLFIGRHLLRLKEVSISIAVYTHHTTRSEQFHTSCGVAAAQTDITCRHDRIAGVIVKDRFQYRLASVWVTVDV